MDIKNKIIAHTILPQHIHYIKIQLIPWGCIRKRKYCKLKSEGKITKNNSNKNQQRCKNISRRLCTTICNNTQLVPRNLSFKGFKQLK